MDGNRTIFFNIILLTCLLNSFIATATKNRDTTYYELWYIDTLENIGGHSISIIGDPQVVSTDMGRAVRFDGDGDMLLVDANPLGDTKEFTIEIIFKPDGVYPQNADPRFVHVQDPDDTEAKRVMIELRLTADNLWYLDGFMNTDNASLTLVDASLTHPTGQWMHAAVSYQDGHFKTWVNGIEELSGSVTYASEIVALDSKTSLGARMNQKNWYSGIIKALKVTHRALDPTEFLSLEISSLQQFKLNEPELTVYPNPAKEHVTVTAASAFPDCLVKVSNVTGETVYHGQWIPAKRSSYHISTSDFPEGIYLIEFITDRHYQVKKLMIIH